MRDVGRTQEEFVNHEAQPSESATNYHNIKETKSLS